MSIDTNKDGTLSADEIVTAAQGFLTAAVSDVLRVIAATSSALVLALTLWQAMHPAVVAPVPTTGPVPVPALPDAPHDTDATLPAATDTDAVKATP